ncbi:MAG: hypothetical protein LBH21_08810, partial [Gracilibacteraceae bacterium]|nr:hypothetical protein [Gracilibacteraceae bacterium]
MKKRGIVLSVLCILAVLFAAGCGGGGAAGTTGGGAAGTAEPASEPVTIKVACDNVTGGPWDLGFKDFMARVEEKIPGKVNFEYYPDGQLSNNDQRTTIEMIQTGSVHIACFIPAIYEQFDQRFQ